MDRLKGLFGFFQRANQPTQDAEPTQPKQTAAPMQRTKRELSSKPPQATKPRATPKPSLTLLKQGKLSRHFKVVKDPRTPVPKRRKAFGMQDTEDNEDRAHKAKVEYILSQFRDEEKHTFKPLVRDERAHLLGLPIELREKIYEKLFPDRFVEIDCDNAVEPTTCPDILLTCKQIQKEASKICDDQTVLRLTKHRHDHFLQIEGALDYMGEARLHRVRQFYFAWPRKPFAVFVTLTHNPAQDIQKFKHRGTYESPLPRATSRRSHYAKVVGHRHFVVVCRLAHVSKEEYFAVQFFCDELAKQISSRADSILRSRPDLDMYFAKKDVIAIAQYIDFRAPRLLPKDLLDQWEMPREVTALYAYGQQPTPRHQDSDEEMGNA